MRLWQPGGDKDGHHKKKERLCISEWYVPQCCGEMLEGGDVRGTPTDLTDQKNKTAKNKMRENPPPPTTPNSPTHWALFYFLRSYDFSCLLFLSFL